MWKVGSDMILSIGLSLDFQPLISLAVAVKQLSRQIALA